MSHKLLLKLFLADGSTLTDEQIVPIFHSWIQTHALPDHLLIDVADYAHVHHGPGTLLVSHEANIALDHTAGRSGLLYQRKQPFAGPSTFAQNLAALFKYTLTAARLLEQAVPGAQFRTDEFQFRIADRLTAPNTAETVAAVRPQLESFLATVLPPGTFQFIPGTNPEELLEITIRSTANITLGDVLIKLS